jgi:hypothetical protein
VKFHPTLKIPRCRTLLKSAIVFSHPKHRLRQAVGIKEIHDDIWLVSFMDYDLGYFDLETRMLEPIDNPFGPRLSPM